MANWASTQALGDSRSPEWQAENLTWIEPIKGQRWQVYKPAQAAFEGLLGDLINLGYHPTSSGGYNYRNKRGGNSLSQHAFGTAIDLNSMQNAMGQSATDIPHAAELAKKWGLDWGGNWKNPDPMHFEYQGGGGQAQAVDAQMKAAGYTPEQRRNAIASIESAGSGDYGALGAWTGDPSDGRDRAYGRYQVMGKNLAPWAEQYLGMKGLTSDQFLKDPALQDKLFDAVYGDYATKYGERGAASKWFTGSEKEPNRTDVNGKLTGGTYADKYMAALGGAPTVNHPPNPTVGTGGYTAPGADTTAVPDAKPDFMSKLRKGLKGLGGGMGGGGGAGPAQMPMPAQVAAARIDQGETPTIDPQVAEMQRQQLAMAMQRLNSGRLF